ncbi:MAG TPA: cohesin domain-containing protein [Candidatus Paceibacterota bacterium]
MIFNKRKNIYWFWLIILLFAGFSANAQIINVDANKLLVRSEVSLSPRSGSFVEGSTFQVPIFLNTKGRSINGIEVRINFDKDKLLIVNPSGGTSIIGVWVEPPSYDNFLGTASYIGVVPNGIITEAGLIGTITFKVKATGRAVISVNSNSKILLNDGLGSATIVDLGRAEYNLLIKPPEGVLIYSETHPFQTNWYNNNNAILSWDKDPGVMGFSYILDDQPNTIPDNIIDSEETTKTYEKLDDGLWYFHIKANKAGAWGTTGHFLLKIDTAPPAKFRPEVNYLLASTISVERTLVSFFTTDNLSGIDHYEVGIIDKGQPLTKSPVFIQTESPFQVPLISGNKLQVIVRAIDKAGNARDESVDVRAPLVISKFIEDYLVYILLFIILLGIIMLLVHYLFGHHIIQYIRRIFNVIKTEEKEKADKILLPGPSEEHKP